MAYCGRAETVTGCVRVGAAVVRLCGCAAALRQEGAVWEVACMSDDSFRLAAARSAQEWFPS